jgi:hypothetical protein
MGFFSFLKPKKPINEIVEEYTNSYNKIIYSDSDSINAFKNLALFNFNEAIRQNSTIHTEPISALGWYQFKINELSGNHNDDRSQIASYIFNAVASNHKDFWNPVSNEKMQLLKNLIEEKLVGKVSNLDDLLKNAIVATCQEYNASTWRNVNGFDSLEIALRFATENYFCEIEEEELNECIQKYKQSIKEIIEKGTTELQLRSLVVEAISDFFYTHYSDDEYDFEDYQITVSNALYKS